MDAAADNVLAPRRAIFAYPEQFVRHESSPITSLKPLAGTRAPVARTSPDAQSRSAHVQRQPEPAPRRAPPREPPREPPRTTTLSPTPSPPRRPAVEQSAQPDNARPDWVRPTRTAAEAQALSLDYQPAAHEPPRVGARTGLPRPRQPRRPPRLPRVAQDEAPGGDDAASATKPAARVLHSYPVDGASHVPVRDYICITFSADMAAWSVERAFRLCASASGEAVRGSFVWSSEPAELVFTPRRPLAPLTRYQLALDSAAGGAWAQSGAPLAPWAGAAFMTAASDDEDEDEDNNDDDHAAAAVRGWRASSPATADLFDGASDAPSFASALTTRSARTLGSSSSAGLSARARASAVSSRLYAKRSMRDRWALHDLDADDASQRVAVRRQRSPSISRAAAGHPALPPPVVLSCVPAPGQTEVDPRANIVVRFDRPMQRHAVERAFALRAADCQIPGVFAWDQAGRVLTFDPDPTLRTDALHWVSLSQRACAEDGTALAAPHRSNFRTAISIAVHAD